MMRRLSSSRGTRGIRPFLPTPSSLNLSVSSGTSSKNTGQGGQVRSIGFMGRLKKATSVLMGADDAVIPPVAVAVVPPVGSVNPAVQTVVTPAPVASAAETPTQVSPLQPTSVPSPSTAAPAAPAPLKHYPAATTAPSQLHEANVAPLQVSGPLPFSPPSHAPGYASTSFSSTAAQQPQAQTNMTQGGSSVLADEVSPEVKKSQALNSAGVTPKPAAVFDPPKLRAAAATAAPPAAVSADSLLQPTRIKILGEVPQSPTQAVTGAVLAPAAPTKLQATRLVVPTKLPSPLPSSSAAAADPNALNELDLTSILDSINNPEPSDAATSPPEAPAGTAANAPPNTTTPVTDDDIPLDPSIMDSFLANPSGEQQGRVEVPTAPKMNGPPNDQIVPTRSGDGGFTSTLAAAQAAVGRQKTPGAGATGFRRKEFSYADCAVLVDEGPSLAAALEWHKKYSFKLPAVPDLGELNRDAEQNIHIISTPEDAEFAANELHEFYTNGKGKAMPIMGLDLEWVRNKNASLLQIATDDKVYLFRLSQAHEFEPSTILEMELPQPLMDILANPKILKCTVYICEDAKRLSIHTGTAIKGCVDLTLLFLYIGYPLGKYRGLKALAGMVWGVQLQKEMTIRCSNWERSELDVEQVEYAVADARASHAVLHAVVHCYKLTTAEEVVEFVQPIMDRSTSGNEETGLTIRTRRAKMKEIVKEAEAAQEEARFKGEPIPRVPSGIQIREMVGEKGSLILREMTTRNALLRLVDVVSRRAPQLVPKIPELWGKLSKPSKRVEVMNQMVNRLVPAKEKEFHLLPQLYDADDRATLCSTQNTKLAPHATKWMDKNVGGSDPRPHRDSRNEEIPAFDTTPSFDMDSLAEDAAAIADGGGPSAPAPTPPQPQVQPQASQQSEIDLGNLDLSDLTGGEDNDELFQDILSSVEKTGAAATASAPAAAAMKRPEPPAAFADPKPPAAAPAKPTPPKAAPVAAASPLSMLSGVDDDSDDVSKVAENILRCTAEGIPFKFAQGGGNPFNFTGTDYTTGPEVDALLSETQHLLHKTPAAAAGGPATTTSRHQVDLPPIEEAAPVPPRTTPAAAADDDASDALLAAFDSFQMEDVPAKKVVGAGGPPNLPPQARRGGFQPLPLENQVVGSRNAAPLPTPAAATAAAAAAGGNLHQYTLDDLLDQSENERLAEAQQRPTAVAPSPVQRASPQVRTPMSLPPLQPTSNHDLSRLDMDAQLASVMQPTSASGLGGSQRNLVSSLKTGRAPHLDTTLGGGSKGNLIGGGGGGLSYSAKRQADKIDVSSLVDGWVKNEQSASEN